MRNFPSGIVGVMSLRRVHESSAARLAKTDTVEAKAAQGREHLWRDVTLRPAQTVTLGMRFGPRHPKREVMSPCGERSAKSHRRETNWVTGPAGHLPPALTRGSPHR